MKTMFASDLDNSTQKTSIEQQQQYLKTLNLTDQKKFLKNNIEQIEQQLESVQRELRTWNEQFKKKNWPLKPTLNDMMKDAVSHELIKKIEQLVKQKQKFKQVFDSLSD